MVDSENFKVIIAGDVSAYENNDKFTVKTTPSMIYSRPAAGTGIVADSDNKETAFELLTLVRTEPEVLKFLVLSDPESEQSVVFTAELIIGDNYFSADTSGSKEYYDNDVSASVFLGFNADYSEISDNLSEIISICNDGLNVWKSENFEEEFEQIRQRLDEAGINEFAEEINEQFESFKTDGEQP